MKCETPRLCPVPSARLGVNAGTQTPLSCAALAKHLAGLPRSVKSASSAGDKRSPLSERVGDSLRVSGSAGIGRFLKGSLEEDLSVVRLCAVPVPESGALLSAGQRIPTLFTPVRSGAAAGEPPAARQPPARPLKSGDLHPALPRSRLVVRRSSGAEATDWWSPFMVMILGINRRQGVDV